MDCLNNIKTFEDHGICFMAVTEASIPIYRIRHAGFCCTCLGPRATSKDLLSGNGSQPGRLRSQQDYNAGKVAKTVYSRSGKNLPVWLAEVNLQPGAAVGDL